MNFDLDINDLGREARVDQNDIKFVFCMEIFLMIILLYP